MDGGADPLRLDGRAQVTERIEIEQQSLHVKGADAAATDVAADGFVRKIGLVLASHHPLTLCGLSQVFEREADCTVLAACTHAVAVVEIARRHAPDIIILDLERQDVLRVVRQLQREEIPARVMVLASAADEAAMAEATRAGAHAIVRKEVSPEAFLATVRQVSRVEVHRGPDLDGAAFKTGPTAFRRHPTRSLTPREAEIAQLAVRGISTKDIAARLDVKQGTVKIHLHSIYEKLNVGGRLGLVLYARRHRLL